MSAKPTHNAQSLLPTSESFSTAHSQEPCDFALDPSVAGIAPLIRARLLALLPETLTADKAASHFKKAKSFWKQFCKSGAGPKPMAHGRGRGAKLKYAREDVVDALMRGLAISPEPLNERA
jgi:hypothetical protein